MVVKDKIGRNRYIVFELQHMKQYTKNDIINLLRQIFSDERTVKIPWVIKCNNHRVMVRCRHTEKQTVIKKLNTEIVYHNEKLNIRTIGTSGTIKCATKNFFRHFSPLNKNK